MVDISGDDLVAGVQFGMISIVAKVHVAAAGRDRIQNIDLVVPRDGEYSRLPKAIESDDYEGQDGSRGEAPGDLFFPDGFDGEQCNGDGGDIGPDEDSQGEEDAAPKVLFPVVEEIGTQEKKGGGQFAG